MQKKDNAPFNNQPNGTKNGRPEEANFVKKQVFLRYPKTLPDLKHPLHREAISIPHPS
jgi:hypothetical protein